jgi:hypothetical protein
MADKKISALPAATTPLAGTEVLPIVQGGTTDQVSVANLTAGRAVSAAQLDVDNVRLDGNTISTTNTNGNLTLDANGTGFTVLTGPTNGTIAQMGDTNSRTFYIKQTAAGGFDNDTLVFESDSGVGQYQWKNNGGTTLWSMNRFGNLAPAVAGTGIDFSASTHAAGMTSELLNDYEEGTYTVAIGCGTSGTVTLNTSFDTAQYTKVGRLVTVTGGVIVSSVSSPTGYFTISLPFTSASLSELSGYFLSVLTISGVNTANIADFVSLGVTGASSIRVYLGDATGLQGDSAQELKAGTEMYFTISYIAA